MAVASLMTALASSPYRSPVPASSTPEHVGRPFVDRHPQSDFAARGVAKQEKPGTAGTLAEDLVHGAEREARRACPASAMSSW